MSAAVSRLTAAQARMLEAVRGGDVALHSSPRGGYYWAVSGVRCSPSTDRMLDRLCDVGAVTTARMVRGVAVAIPI